MCVKGFVFQLFWWSDSDNESGLGDAGLFLWTDSWRHGLTIALCPVWLIEPHHAIIIPQGYIPATSCTEAVAKRLWRTVKTRTVLWFPFYATTQQF